MDKTSARRFLGSLPQRTRWVVALVAVALVVVAITGVLLSSTGQAAAAAQPSVSPA